MSSKTTLRSLCVTRIAPLAAALALTLTATSWYALDNAAGGRALVESKVGLIKPGSTILKASAADLIAAVGLAIEQQREGTAVANVDIVDIVSGVLLASGNKVRGDRDTIAGQLITTGSLLGDLTPDQLATAVKNVYSVNTGTTKFQLTTKGKANAIIAGVQSATSTANAALIGTAVAPSIGPDPDFLNVSAALSAALVKGKNTLQVADNLASFYGAGYVAKNLTSATAPAFANTIAEKVANANPELAGIVYGGLASAFPLSYSTADQGAAFVASVTGTAGAKLKKAVGAIVGDTLSRLDATQIDAVARDARTVFGGTTKTTAADSLLAQGLLRVSDDLTKTTVDFILGKIVGATTGAKKATLAGVIATGNRDLGTAGDQTLTLAIDNISAGLSSAKDIGAVGAAAINAAGAADPRSAAAVVDALFDNGLNATTLGQSIVPKLKVYAAAGYMAREIVDLSNVGDVAAGALAGNIMVKGKKAANDIANQVGEFVSTLPAGNDVVLLAQSMANTQKTIAQNAAVGVSISSPELAGNITAGVITHGNGDTAILGKAATISAAVALAADAETASLIAAAVGAKMSDKGTGANKPIKLSLVTSLATGLVKSLQNKPGVDSQNRMDEIGEVAAALSQAIIDSGASATVGDKLIAAVGTAVIKGLSKTAAFKSEYVFYKAGLIEAGDVAGSMALTLKIALEATQNSRLEALIGPTGTLTKALLKAAGKTGSAANTAVSTALNTVFTKSTTDPLVAGYETGAFFDRETDTRDF